MHVNELPEIARLSTPEKILLVEDLWDDIASDASSVPVPESHLAELRKRLMNHRANPGNLLSLKDLQEQIERRKP